MTRTPAATPASSTHSLRPSSPAGPRTISRALRRAWPHTLSPGLPKKLDSRPPSSTSTDHPITSRHRHRRHSSASAPPDTTRLRTSLAHVVPESASAGGSRSTLGAQRDLWRRSARLSRGARRTVEDGGHVLQQLEPSRSEEHTSELQSHSDLVCRLLLE